VFDRTVSLLVPRARSSSPATTAIARGAQQRARRVVDIHEPAVPTLMLLLTPPTPQRRRRRYGRPIRQWQ
jgi:hypothetical protein